MKLSRKNIFAGMFVFGLLVNFLVYYDINWFFARTILAFIYLITIPGFLIALLLKIRKISFWEYLVYVIGLSIGFLMFGGLFANSLLPLLGTAKPLSLIPISLCLNALLVVLGLIAYRRNKKLSYQLKPIRLSKFNWFCLIVPVLFPILSVMGAISLNNGGTNIFTMVMLGGIALYAALLVIFGDKIDENVYPPSIYLIAISLLLMISLRGWYVTGHDIQEEFYVFQLTKNNYIWNMNLFNNAYNACLSLNILPTIFSSLTGIADAYIFKTLYQVIAPFTILSIFLLIKKYTTNTISFMCVFLFMSFPAFLNDMPMLNRQEIAFVFFALMLLVLFNKTITSPTKKLLFLLFGFSMVVSHYSTSYVAIALIALTYSFAFLFKSATKRGYLRNKIRLSNSKYHLTQMMVIGLLFFTYLWNSQITKTAGGLSTVIAQSWQNLNKSFNQDLKSTDVLYSIFNWQKLDKEKIFNDYLNARGQEVNASEERDLYYEKEVYEKFKIELQNEETTPLTPLGQNLQNISVDVFSLNYYYKQGSAKVIQLFLIVGFFAILLGKNKYTKKIDVEYLFLAFAGILLVGLMTLLPLFSLQYGALRFFQQTLIVASLPIIIGGLTLFNKIHNKNGLYLILVFCVIFFLSTSDFIPQLTGGFYPLLNSSNEGIRYNCVYTHKSEIDSTNWLVRTYDGKYDIQTNECMSFKVLAIAGVAPVSEILPAETKKDSYVLLDYYNVKNGKDRIYVNSTPYDFAQPVEFLNENKDLVYTNGESSIYK